MRILVTGGAGYIGSHAAKRLLSDGHEVVVLDNLCMGHRAVADLLSNLAPNRFSFVEADIRDTKAVAQALQDHPVDAVMHFAAFAFARESVAEPLKYYETNVAGLVSLLQAIDQAAPTLNRFVFSSSCATYGQPDDSCIPINETCPQNPMSPYGWSKLMDEQVLLDYVAARRAAGTPFSLALLRYFNVAGADTSGVLGEDHDPETHIVPLLLQAAMGRREPITIFGDDHPTPDGTCVRDYLHVQDLADAHAVTLAALDPSNADRSTLVYNLGTGTGASNKELAEAASKAVGKQVPLKWGPRHQADPARLTADASKIERELGWKPQIPDINDVVRTAYEWFAANPNGYKK